MRKTVLLLLFMVASTAFLRAQTLDQFKSKLSVPTQGSARVQINEHELAATAVRSMQVQPSGEKVKGYRVCIFFDNVQNAGDLAKRAMARFKELYPTIPAYWAYEAPSFRVTVGNCLTVEEANILLGRIRGAFDRPFRVRAEIPLSLFGQSAESTTSESTAELSPEITPN